LGIALILLLGRHIEVHVFGIVLVEVTNIRAGGQTIALGPIIVGIIVGNRKPGTQAVRGFEKQITADAPVLRLVGVLVHAGVIVFDPTVVLHILAVETRIQGVLQQAAADVENPLHAVEAAVLCSDLAVPFIFGVLGHDIDDPADGVLAVKRALGASQHLDAFHVGQEASNP